MSFADAIGVASAIVQLVQFSANVISGARDVYSHSQLKEHAELDLVQKDLDSLIEDITTRGSEAARLGLDELATLCCKIGLELKDALSKLRAREGGGSRVGRMGRSLSIALLTVLSKDKIKGLQQRLEAVRDEIQFKLVVLTSNRTEDLASSFAITHDKLLEVSAEAAHNAKEFKTKQQEQYMLMTDVEKRLLDSLATQNHTLYEVARMLSAEAEEQHDRTREELRTLGSEVVEQNIEQHDQTRERIGRVYEGVGRVHTTLAEHKDMSTAHTTHLSRVEDTVVDIRQRIDLQKEEAARDKEEAARRERKRRMWQSVNSNLHPTDRRGRRLRMSEGERAARYAMAASIVSLHYGSEAMRSLRGDDGRIKLPIDASAMPDVKAPQIQMPKIDLGKIRPPTIDAAGVKRTFDAVGANIQQTSVAGFEATKKFFGGLPRYFQATPQGKPDGGVAPGCPPDGGVGSGGIEVAQGAVFKDEDGVEDLTLQITRVEMVDMELIDLNDEELPPPKPPRPTKSSPRVAPKPAHLRSFDGTGSVSPRMLGLGERTSRSPGLKGV